MVCPLAGRDADEVETTGALPCVVSVEPSLSGTDEAFLLDGGECLVRALQTAVGASLHFHEDEDAAFFGHDVQFEMA